MNGKGTETVRRSGDGRRLDVLLSADSGLTRSRVAALIAEGLCRVDGTVCRKPGEKVPEGRSVELTVPAPKETAPKAEDIPLEVLFEDEDLAVVVKPRGMVVHPAAGHEDGTLVNALLARLGHLGGIGGELRPGIVHRLDKDTSGLLMVAKNDETQLALSRMLRRSRRAGWSCPSGEAGRTGKKWPWIPKAGRRSRNGRFWRRAGAVLCWTCGS